MRKVKRLTRREKIQALMDNFGITRKEAIIDLKDMGEY